MTLPFTHYRHHSTDQLPMIEVRERGGGRREGRGERGKQTRERPSNKRGVWEKHEWLPSYTVIMHTHSYCMPMGRTASV